MVWSGSWPACLPLPFMCLPLLFMCLPGWVLSFVSHFFSFVSQAGCLWSRSPSFLAVVSHFLACLRIFAFVSHFLSFVSPRLGACGRVPVPASFRRGLGRHFSFFRCVRPFCHCCWCPPFSAGHAEFLFICLPGSPR